MSMSRRDFLFSAGGALAACRPAKAQAQPVVEFLKDKKLTLPDFDDRGRAIEAEGEALASLQSPWVIYKPDSIVLICPAQGATTTNATSPRSEFRYLKNYSLADEFSNVAAFRVNQLEQGAKVVVHQIHAGGKDDRPLVKLTVFYDGKGKRRLYALVKTSATDDADLTVPLLDDFKPQEVVQSYIHYIPAGELKSQTLIFGAQRIDPNNGNEVVARVAQGAFAYRPEDPGTYIYLKEGNYYSAVKGSSAICEIETMLAPEFRQHDFDAIRLQRV